MHEQRITAKMKVAEVVKTYPETVEVFLGSAKKNMRRRRRKTCCRKKYACRSSGMCLGIAVLALLVAAPLRTGWEEHLQRLTLSTSLRTRYELWNWFDPGNRAAPQDNNDYGFGATLLRLGLRYDAKKRGATRREWSCSRECLPSRGNTSSDMAAMNFTNSSKPST